MSGTRVNTRNANRRRRFGASQPRLQPGRGRGWVQAALVAAVLQVYGAQAGAEEFRIEPSITSSLLWSDNTQLGIAPRAESDFIVDVRPSLRLSAGGPNLRINGSLGLVSTTYTQNTESNETSPQADLLVSAVLAQRLLYLDTSVRSFESTADTFGTRASATSTANRYTTMQYAVSPYLEHQWREGARLTVRSDNTWTASHGDGAPNDDGYFGRHSARFAIEPEPVGFGLEAERATTKYRDSSESLDRDLVRGLLSAAYDQRYQVAAIAGHERYRIAAGMPQESHSVYGVRFEWKPSERTDLTATVERRFFGTGWDANFRHRSPFISWNFSAMRQASSYAERLFSVPSGGDIASLLDAAFMTRFPDPTERARMVQDFLAQRGLPSTTSTSLNVFSDRIDLYQAVMGSVAYIAPRDSTTLTVFRSRVETLPGLDPIFSMLFPADYRDAGWSVNWSHRLTPQTAAITSYRHSLIEGFNANEGERTKQNVAQLELNHALSPKTAAQVGVRYQVFDSTVNYDGHESAAYVGLRHRF